MVGRQRAFDKKPPRAVAKMWQLRFLVLGFAQLSTPKKFVPSLVRPAYPRRIILSDRRGLSFPLRLIGPNIAKFLWPMN
jgi:hypothetical protein